MNHLHPLRQALQDMFNTGLIDKDEFMQQLDCPDLQGTFDLETADKVNVDDRIEAMLEADEASAKVPLSQQL